MAKKKAAFDSQSLFLPDGSAVYIDATGHLVYKKAQPIPPPPVTLTEVEHIVDETADSTEEWVKGLIGTALLWVFLVIPGIFIAAFAVNYARQGVWETVNAPFVRLENVEKLALQADRRLDAQENWLRDHAMKQGEHTDQSIIGCSYVLPGNWEGNR